jgi:hypothetical protein
LARCAEGKRRSPIPNAHNDRSVIERSHKWVTMIRKLRWIGMEKEARRLQVLLNTLPKKARDSVAAGPLDTD